MKSRYHLLLMFVIALILFAMFMFLPDFRRLVFRGTQIDSIGHMIGFFALTWVLHSILKLPLVNTVLTMILYSALTELGQYYLGFRSGEFSDFFSDLVGIALFGVIRWAILVYGNKRAT
jgi:VanZ family protein